MNLYDVLFADNKAAVQAALDVISGKLRDLKENGLLPHGQTVRTFFLIILFACTLCQH